MGIRDILNEKVVSHLKRAETEISEAQTEIATQIPSDIQDKDTDELKGRLKTLEIIVQTLTESKGGK